MPNEKLRFAVVGCGMLAQSQHLPNIVRSSKAALEVCCDVDAATLAQCRAKFSPARTTTDYRDAIADPRVEAICLATTQKLRLPVIEAAAAAGKPIYVEKPLANTLDEMYRIQKVVRQAKIPACVGHNRRCSPAMADAHRIFRSHMEQPTPCPWRWDREGPDRPDIKENGSAAMSVRINDDWYSWKLWAFDPVQAPDGPMIFEMTHFTDLCNWFLAAVPKEVVAMENGPLASAVIIRYQTGELASILMSGNGTFGYPKELYEMMGQGAAVVVDHMLEVRTCGIEGAPSRQVYPMQNDHHPQVGTEGGLSGWLAKKRAAAQEAVAKGDPKLQFTAEPDKGHAHALDRFVDEIRGQGPVVCGVDDAVMATRVAFAAVLSARERRIVSLDEI